MLHFRVVEKIGEGGMGEVWRAVDTTLDREVALKFLPAQAAGDVDRMARFEREAKLLATLNHPNIAGVYGLHEADGRRFIVMEYVPGEDLAERLARGPLAVEDAVDVARQVADALEAAHDQGVVHRDLKPANIKRTPDGKIKVLDLGLAKAFAPEISGGSASVSLSPTVTSAGTQAGVLLGTAAYMSPEQAKGRPVDRRADIWAFGVVVHEMLTGKKMFDAETVSETLAAVLRDDVPFDTLPPETPPAVSGLLRRCLDRDPRTRLRDIGEARVSLSGDLSASAVLGAAGAAPGSADGVEVAAATFATSPVGRALPWVLVAVLAFVAAFALWRVSTGTAAGDPEMLTLVAPFRPGDQLPMNQMGVMALSPDGKSLALVLEGHEASARKLFVRRLDTGEFEELAGTDDAATPFFSPDGKWIAFFADNKLKKVPVAGGSPVTLCDADGNNRGASWGTDDFIVFSPHYTMPLMRVSGAGGDPMPLTEIDAAAGDRTHRWPQSVPGEDVVLYTVGTMDSPESYDGARIDAIRPSTGERRTVLERASMARYVPTGHLVFGREGFLFAVPFDVDALEVRGNPVPVLEDVMGMRNSGVVHAAVSNDGLLAYVEGAPQSRKTRMVWRTVDGAIEPLAAPVAGYVNPEISPDRTRVAVQIEGETTFDVWTYHLEQDTLTRLTFDGDNYSPVWSPDGERIAFASVRNDDLMSVYVKSADGGGQAELVYAADRLPNTGQAVPRAWTPDGSAIVVEFTNENATNVAVYDLAEDDLRVVLDTPAAESAASLSPNGRWLAYMSDESQDFQVFIRAFAGPGGKWQVSTDGGAQPRWSPDGRALFFRWQRSLYVVDVEESGGSIRTSRPRLLFDDLGFAGSLGDFDVLDRTRFLVTEPADDGSAPAGVTVVTHWLDDLARRVPR